MPRAFVPSRRLIGALLVALALPLLAQSGAGDPAKDDPSVSNAEKLGRVANSLMLDAVQTNAGFFVVGERGHILSSTDGKTWAQAEVPTRSALTSIATADGQLWAAGHDGVILDLANQYGYGDANERLVQLVRSDPIPSDPIVVRVPDAERAHLQAALVAAGNTPEGKAALEIFWGMVQGLRAIEANAYDVLGDTMTALGLEELDLMSPT